MLDTRVKFESTAAKPIGLGPGVRPGHQAQSSHTIPSFPAAPGAVPASATPALSQAGLSGPGEAEAEDAWPRPQEEPDKKRRYVSPTDQGGNWLLGEPNGWIGRKIRNRANAAVYVVRQIFKNGRVQLERNWMSYMTDVQTVREKYEPQV